MHTEARFTASRPIPSVSDTSIPDTLSPHIRSGPRTPEGKTRSAANSTTLGLFTANNYVEPGEESEYAGFIQVFHHQLDPEGPIEEAIARETVNAAWRLRRCGIIESNLLTAEDPGATQLSVDRARNQAHRLFLKGIAELRKLQTERQLRYELLPQSRFNQGDSALVSFRDIIQDLSTHANLQLANRRLEGVDTIAKIFDKSLPQPQSAPAAGAPEVRFVIPLNTPRNAPCPCKSGEKYKRCCGKNAPPVLNNAPPVLGNAPSVPATRAA
jgi:hypothetical protein